MKTANKFFLLLIVFVATILVSGFLARSVFAQEFFDVGVAMSAQIPDVEVPEGSIVCTDGNQFFLCNTEYAVEIFGVVTASPAAAFVSTNIEDSYPVLTSGRALVRVNSSKGAIASGDLVTSSTNAGVGVKAIKNGFVIGTALEGWDNSDPGAEGLIEVAVKVHPSLNLQGIGENLFETLREGLSVPFLDPLSALRYLMAAAIVVLSFVIGFVYFGRVAKAGVEAIGRNPLAGARIQLAVFVQVALTIGIGLVGLALAYFILVL